jgi:hypothetical protein
VNHTSKRIAAQASPPPPTHRSLLQDALRVRGRARAQKAKHSLPNRQHTTTKPPKQSLLTYYQSPCYWYKKGTGNTDIVLRRDDAHRSMVGAGHHLAHINGAAWDNFHVAITQGGGHLNSQYWRDCEGSNPGGLPLQRAGLPSCYKRVHTHTCRT